MTIIDFQTRWGLVAQRWNKWWCEPCEVCLRSLATTDKVTSLNHLGQGASQERRLELSGCTTFLLASTSSIQLKLIFQINNKLSRYHYNGDPCIRYELICEVSFYDETSICFTTMRWNELEGCIQFGHWSTNSQQTPWGISTGCSQLAFGIFGGGKEFLDVTAYSRTGILSCWIYIFIAVDFLRNRTGVLCACFCRCFNGECLLPYIEKASNDSTRVIHLLW